MTTELEELVRQLPSVQLECLEASYIQRIIYREKGNLTTAAKVLGISRATLYRKVGHYQLKRISDAVVHF